MKKHVPNMFRKKEKVPNKNRWPALDRVRLYQEVPAAGPRLVELSVDDDCAGVAIEADPRAGHDEERVGAAGHAAEGEGPVHEARGRLFKPGQHRCAQIQ